MEIKEFDGCPVQYELMILFRLTTQVRKLLYFYCPSQLFNILRSHFTVKNIYLLIEETVLVFKHLLVKKDDLLEREEGGRPLASSNAALKTCKLWTANKGEVIDTETTSLALSQYYTQEGWRPISKTFSKSRFVVVVVFTRIYR